MAEISGSSWSETDALNSSPAPNGFPEGMPFSGVNDSARAVMGAVKRFWGRINGRYASTGSSNAYVLTPDVALSAYVTGERYSFRANFANTGAATLNISSLGAKSIKKMTASGKADLAPGDIQQGQSVTVEYDGTDMVMVTPVAPAGAPVAAPRTIAAGAGLAGGGDLSADRTLSVIVPLGQCRLTKSGDDLHLSRHNGRFLFIGGALHEIPAEGVTLAPSGLDANTVYYIYACIDDGDMKLEASTTPPTVASAYGNMVKGTAGGEQYSLVGMARVVAGPAWADSDAQRFVLSYYNRRTLPVVGANTNGVTSTSTGAVELTTAARAEFLTWGDEAVSIGIAGYARNSNGLNAVYALVGLDGGVVGTESVGNVATNNAPMPQNPRHTALLSEGYHFATPIGRVSGGTGTFHYQVHATIQG